MLILTRRTGETIRIGDQISITILGVKGQQVRVGINAPKTVEVHREEIYERIHQEREQEQKSGVLARSVSDTVGLPGTIRDIR